MPLADEDGKAPGAGRSAGISGANSKRGARHYWRKTRRQLTPTETAVVDHLAEGLSNGEIAARMAVSYKAVDGHLQNIYAKLNVRSRLQAALKWQAYRLVGRPPYGQEG